MNLKLKDKYEAAFRKAIPYAMPFIAIAGLAAQFKIAQQNAEITELQNQNEKIELRTQGNLLSNSNAQGEDVHSWLTQLVDTDMISPQQIPGYYDPDFFEESFNRQKDQDKILFVQSINEKASGFKRDKIIALTYKLG
jgi:hypothetical protein